MRCYIRENPNNKHAKTILFIESRARYDLRSYAALGQGLLPFIQLILLCNYKLTAFPLYKPGQLTG